VLSRLSICASMSLKLSISTPSSSLRWWAMR
jgi:hypothetical protein